MSPQLTGILALAYGCGLRRAQLAALQVGDFDGARLTVHGKRNKTRLTPVAEGALDALQAWLAVRGDSPGPLFVRILKGDRVKAVRAAQAGVKEFSPHDLRRTFAGELLVPHQIGLVRQHDMSQIRHSLTKSMQG